MNDISTIPRLGAVVPLTMRIVLQPAGATCDAAPSFEPVTSPIARALVNDAPGHAASRRPATAVAPSATFALD